MRRATLPDLRRGLALAAVLVASACSGQSSSDGAPAQRTVEMTAVAPATAPSVTTSGDPTTVEIWQFATTCCYVEGSLGLMQILSVDGDSISGVLPGHGKRERDDSGDPWSGWEPIDLPPGDYRIEVWQSVCPGMCRDPKEIAARDWNNHRGRSDLCTTTVHLEAGEQLELTATYEPSVDCISFDPTIWTTA